MSQTSGLVGVIVGGLLAIAGSATASAWQFYSTRMALKAAFASEIQSIILLVDERKFVQRLQEEVNSFDKNQKLIYGYAVYGSDPPWKWAVYENNADKLGFLGADAAHDIVQFYTMLQSIQVDLAAITAGKVPDVGVQTGMVREDLRLWESVKNTSQKIIKDFSR